MIRKYILSNNLYLKTNQQFNKQKRFLCYSKILYDKNYSKRNEIYKTYSEKNEDDDLTINYDNLNDYLERADYEAFNWSFPDEFDEENMPKPTLKQSIMNNSKELVKLSKSKKTISNTDRIFRQLHDDEKKLKITAHDELLQKLPHHYEIAQGIHTRVTAKGRERSFSALVVIGDGKGMAGFGRARGITSEKAKSKAYVVAGKNLIYIPRYQKRGIFYNVTGIHNDTKIQIIKRPRGFGLKAGPIVYSILKAFGITDVTTKVTGNNTSISQVYATFNALLQIVSNRQLSLSRGKNYYTHFKSGVGKLKVPTYAEHVAQLEKVDSLLKSTTQQFQNLSSYRQNINLTADANNPTTTNNDEDIELIDIKQKPFDPLGYVTFDTKHGNYTKPPKPLDNPRDIY